MNRICGLKIFYQNTIYTVNTKQEIKQMKWLSCYIINSIKTIIVLILHFCCYEEHFVTIYVLLSSFNW